MLFPQLSRSFVIRMPSLAALWDPKSSSESLDFWRDRVQQGFGLISMLVYFRLLLTEKKKDGQIAVAL